MTLTDKDMVRDRSSLGSAMNASLFVGKITNYWIFIGFQDTFLWMLGHFFLENPVKSVNLSPGNGEKWVSAGGWQMAFGGLRCGCFMGGERVLEPGLTSPGLGKTSPGLGKTSPGLEKNSPGLVGHYPWGRCVAGGGRCAGGGGAAVAEPWPGAAAGMRQPPPMTLNA